MPSPDAGSTNGPTNQLAVRLRSIGKLADRLDAGADPVYVLDLAKAIVESCDQFNEEDVPE